jgi:UDP-galactopyranose mutase
MHVVAARGFDYLVVGAGFAGAVAAERLARVSGKRVHVIDRRPHLGGNAHDRLDAHGILVHPHGPHVFHTNSPEVFAYLSQFTQWRAYEHRVLASVEGQLLPFPINLDTVNRLYGWQLTSDELEAWFASVAEAARGRVATLEHAIVRKVGRDLYEKFFRHATRKEWGVDPSELDAGVTSPVTVRTDRDDRCFPDHYQYMPLHGYTAMFERMLDHPDIVVSLDTDYHEDGPWTDCREIIFTGPIDAFFDYRYGALPYRSVEFRFETHDVPRVQPVAVITWPNEHRYTRVTEFKHLTGQVHAKSTLAYEYPTAHGDPGYPIRCPQSAALFDRYRGLAMETPGVHFIGRLASFQDCSMDQVVAQALALCKRLTGVARTDLALAPAAA